MHEDVACVECFEEEWPHFPKNKIWETVLSGGETRVQFACQLETIRLLLVAIIGRRNGIREEIYAIDTSQRVVIDRLLLAEQTTRGNGYFLQLVEMRRKVRYEKQDPRAVCNEELGRRLRYMLERPVFFAACIRSEERNSMSMATLSGGTPGLGKRS